MRTLKLFSIIRQALTWLLVMSVGLYSPITPLLAAQAANRPEPTPRQKLMAQPVSAEERAKRAPALQSQLKLTADATDQDLKSARVFSEPLVPAGSTTVSGENSALAKAILQFKNTRDPEDISPLNSFIDSFPKSRWIPSLQLNLGLARLRTGYLTEALSFLKSASDNSQSASSMVLESVRERADSELVQLQARLGMTDALKKNIASIGKKPMHGSSEARFEDARNGLFTQVQAPERAFRCGPLALLSLIALQGKSKDLSAKVKKLDSTKNGTNLKQVSDWAKELGLDYQIAKKDPGAELIVPAIYHWRLGHFAAIVAASNDHYFLKDPTFDHSSGFGMSRKALESESDGYYLVPAGPLPTGWKRVSDKEAKSVWGRGVASGVWGGMSSPEPRFDVGSGGNGGGAVLRPPVAANQGGSGQGGSNQNSNYQLSYDYDPIYHTVIRVTATDLCTGKSTSLACCMAKFSAWACQAGLNLQDVPLKYTPGVGRTIPFALNYNQNEQQQPSTFTYSNLTPNWSLNWISKLSLDSSNNATILVPGGGYQLFTNTNTGAGNPTYSYDLYANDLLTYVSSGVFQLQSPDGTIMVYNLSDGAGNIFMTEEIDPQGNVCSITYDTTFRITSVTDANGNNSSFSYVSNVTGNSGYYLISSITDPWGRSASFSYDSGNTQLLSITDAVGIVSKFAYQNGSSTISALTTPYGTTRFSQYVPTYTGTTSIPTGLRFTFPDGTCSQIENWASETKETYFWNREAMTLYPFDATNHTYTHCITTRWMFDAINSLEIPVINFVKKPLESLVSYAYPGEYNLDTIDSTALASSVSRTISGSITENAVLAGSTTAGDNFQLIIYDTALPAGEEKVTRVVQSGDTLATVAASLSAAINSDQQLQINGTTSSVNGTTIHITTTSPNTQTFGSANSGSATETATFSANSNLPETVALTGSVTAGDTLTLTISDSSISGGSESVTYTTVSGDSLGTIATNLAKLVNQDSALQSVPVAATAVGDKLQLVSLSLNATTYGKSTSSGSSETITLTAATSSSVIQTSQFQHNDVGNLTQTIDPVGRTFSSTYATNGIDLLQTTETQGSDNYVLGAWSYNTQHLPVQSIDGSGQQISTSYNVFGQPISITDPLSNTTIMTYAGTASATISGAVSSGDSLSITVNDSALSGGSQTISYTTTGGDTDSSIATQLANNINANSNLQTLGVTATATGAVIAITSISPNGTTYSQSVSGAETIALSNVNNGFLQSVDGPLSGSDDITKFAWNNTGTLQSTTNSQEYTTDFSYDNMDRLVQTSFPDGTSNQLVYENLDVVLSIDRLGRVGRRNYNSLDQLIWETDPLGRKTQYSWCLCGSIGALTDPNGNVTRWHHDLQGRVVQKVYPDSSAVNYSYESNSSRLQTKTDALGQVTVYSYNPDNTLLEKDYSRAINPTSSVAFTYDSHFNRISTAANGWGTYTYSYNNYITNPTGTPITGGGRLSSITNNVISNSTIAFSYDALGRTTNRSINGSANPTTWTYDAISRVTAEANNLGTFDYSYVDDVSGSSKGDARLASISYPNGQVTNFSYFGNLGDERLQQIANLNSSGGTLSQFNYGYDSAGQIKQWGQQNSLMSPVINDCEYDLAGQLTGFKGNFGNSSPHPATQDFYGYDPAANRTAVQTSIVQAARISGSKTTGDTVSIVVNDPALSGGSETASYVVQSSDSLASIASNLAAAITADSNLQAIGVNAISDSQTIYIKSASLNNSSFGQSVSSGATEVISLGFADNAIENAVVGGSATASDVLSISVHDAGLSGSVETVSHTVTSGQSLSSIATSLASAINGDSALSAIGVTATSAGSVVSIQSTSPNISTYTSSLSSSATETLALSMNLNTNKTMLIGGSTTASDQLSITVNDIGLSGGSETVTLTVSSGASTSSMASSLASGINADTNLQNIGVSATSSGPVITLVSLSPNYSSYLCSRSSSATETITPFVPMNGTETAAITGSATTGNVLTISVFDAGLSGGTENVSYTVPSSSSLSSIASGIASAINADSNLSGIGVSATAVSSVVNIKSTSINATSYGQSASSGSTESIVLGRSAGVAQYACNNLNELVGISSGGAIRVHGTTNKAVKSGSVSTQVISLTAAAPGPISYSGETNSGATENISISPPINGNVTITISGSKTTGDVLSVVAENGDLPDGSKSVSYTVLSTDSISSIASSLASAISSDTNLKSIGLSATSSSGVISVVANTPTYSESVSSGGTETISLGGSVAGNSTAAISGSKTTGDVLTLTVHHPSLPSGTQAVSYTVLSADNLVSAAAGLASAVNSNSNLQTLGVSASNTASAFLPSTTSFSTGSVIPVGQSIASVSAVDGGNNTTTSSVEMQVPSASSQSLTYDLNGNMTSDGTNSYSWDAQNRLIEITYPSSGNNTQLTYGPTGTRVKIVETTSGSVTSTKQFVGSEERDSSGTVAKQFFPEGEVIGGTAYFYTFDHLGSVREMTDTSGLIQAQLAYDAYGRSTQIQGSLSPDFQYAGYYEHSRSNLNLTLSRAYNPRIGRWINRDPIDEMGGVNLFKYVGNDAVLYNDPEGTNPAAALLSNPAMAAAAAAAAAVAASLAMKSLGDLWQQLVQSIQNAINNISDPNCRKDKCKAQAAAKLQRVRAEIDKAFPLPDDLQGTTEGTIIQNQRNAKYAEAFQEVYGSDYPNCVLSGKDVPYESTTLADLRG